MIRRVQLGLLSVAAVSFVTALVLASSAHDAFAAPNLVTNGDFATDITGWTTGTPGDITIVWDADDADSSASSGSAEVDWVFAGAGQGSFDTPCIDLTASGAGTYQLHAAIKNIANDPGTGIWVRVQLYDEATCVTPSGTPFDTVPVGTNPAWQSVSETNIPVTTQLGAVVSLVIDSAQQNQEAFFDNVSFSAGAPDTPTPTSTNTATNTPTPTDTPVPPTPTDTPVPPTPTDTPVPPTPTDTPVPPTPTDTPLPPTATNTPGGPTDTPTNTPVATDTPAPTNTPVPTATNTPVPPTATNTAVATNTPGGPTNTPMATATSGTPTNTPQATNTAAATETATSEPTATETAIPVATEDVGLPPASGVEQPTNDGGAGGAGGDPSAAGELPETGTGTEAVKDLTLPLVIAGLLALVGAMSLAGVEYHRIRQ